jgi:hypothetical protein
MLKIELFSINYINKIKQYKTKQQTKQKWLLICFQPLQKTCLPTKRFTCCTYPTSRRRCVTRSERSHYVMHTMNIVPFMFNTML